MIALLSAAFLSAAFAAEVHLSAGLEGDVGDPFVSYAGGRVAAEAVAMGWFGGGVAVAGYPDFGASQYRDLLTSLLPTAVPDVSLLRAMGGAYGLVAPVRGRMGALDTSLGLVAGAAAVRTHDQLALVGMEDDADFLATADEWHPASLVGLRGGASHGRVGVQLRLERVAWQESVGSEVQERRAALFVGADVVVRLGGAAAP